MQAIKISEEQKGKLLEICDKLFPELNLFEIDRDGYLMFVPIDQIDDAAIHWFEFCMTHVIRKIEELLPFIGRQPAYWDQLMQHVFYGGHPIDYLYSEFLKMK